MAADSMDLRLLNHGRAPNAAPAAAFPAAPPFSPRKVKFLCSFGGQIIPRPSDGLLRYAGGETRILTFRRDATLAEIMHKMTEILGQTAALRYQLPDVDLDALVSVSNPDDLENMMEEYDKLADSSPDGSAKLRVFLFTPSDAAAASDPSFKPKMDDTAQRYLDAVNGFSSDGSLRRKDSLASGSFTTHNSDGGLVVNAAPASADGGNEGTSSAIPSPTVTNFDQSCIMFAGNQILNTASAIPIHNVANPDHSGLLFAVAPSPAQALNPPQLEFPPASHYADQHQAQYANLQPVPNNVASFSARSYIPPAVHVAPLQPVSHVGSVKVDSHMDENTFSGRAANDPNYKPVYPLLSQLPPLPPTYLQLHNGEWYGMHPAVSPRSQVRVLRMMDCYMCQKGLMHAHSDTVLQENGNGIGSTLSEASVGVPVLQSAHSEDVSRSRAPNQLINELMAERVVETKPENMMPASQFSSYVVPQKPETRHENGKTVVPNAESSDNAVAPRPSTMGLPSASQMSNGLFFNIPPTQYEDSQQQQLPEYVGQPHILVRPDLFTTPYGNGVYPIRNINGYPVEHLTRGSMLESSYGYGRSINGMMESLRVTPYENSGYHENQRPIVTTSNIGAVKELKTENPPLVQSYPVRQQVGGDAAFVGNTFVNPGIVPEGNYVRPADQLLPSSSGLTQLQNFQSVIPSQALLLNPEITSEPMVSNGRLHGNPTFSCGFDPAHNNTINNIPIGDWKEETSQQVKDMTIELGGTPSVIVSIPPSSNGTNGHVELVQEHVPSDPLLYNQDPMKILVSTGMLPPLPLKLASKESVIPKDMPIENLLISTNAPDVAVVIEEGVFHQPPNSVIKESCLEHPVRATRVSGDEHIKQELQALAEGVASSVLQSSVTSAPTFVAREMKDTTTQQNKEWGGIDDSANSHNAAAVGDPRIEEIKTKQIDKENNGFPIGDEIEFGRLQVINNTDLEELRELGSGTFGTVYHGKWRGSDVAIKRINDRCFAGKPSEQERMRADFWNEACNLADLHHPNVVAFYGVVLDGPGGSVATVTEYMANGSLRHALQKNDKTLDQRKRLLIAMDVAFGMEYLHGKSIVHFDLKSDNLLVNLRDPQRPICKVGDLGLSKVKCHTLISGGVRGTLPWMAPELLNGSSSLVSEKVDVFSFGIVMWELLTGKEPYADLHYGMIIGGIVNNTLRPPVPDSCSAEWRSLMEKCWLAEPSERPSFTEIASRLRAMASSLPQKGR